MRTSGVADKLRTALFPKSRRVILDLLLSHPDESFYLRQIVALTGLAVGQVQRELKLLVECGVLQRSEVGRHVFYAANTRCPIFDELQGIMAKTMGWAAVLERALKPLSSRIAVAFVFGSVARGDETRESDLDLMVIGDASFAEVIDAVRSAERTLRREIQVTVYPVVELCAKVGAGHHFLEQVLRGPKHFILGGEDELAALFEQSLDS